MFDHDSRARYASLLALIIASGCTAVEPDPTAVDSESGQDTGEGGGDGPVIEQPKSCDKMDILFVIDNSLSMEDEQANLAANFPVFIDALDAFRTDGDEPIDYRLAVATTGVSKSWKKSTPIGISVPEGIEGEDGVFVQAADCGMTRPWIERADGDVQTTFACAAADVGIEGSGWEMQLEAMHLGLGARIADGTNGAFLRDDALLATVVITDEDDCSRVENDFELGLDEELCDSPAPVAEYLDIFDSLKGHRGRWAASVIAGIEPGSCESELGAALEATRLIEFANLAGDNVVLSSICNGDLAPSLIDALATFDEACATFPPTN